MAQKFADLREPCDLLARRGIRIAVCERHKILRLRISLTLERNDGFPTFFTIIDEKERMKIKYFFKIFISLSFTDRVSL